MEICAFVSAGEKQLILIKYILKSIVIEIYKHKLIRLQQKKHLLVFGMFSLH